MSSLIKALEYINPALCSYQEWINVGMALKLEGYSVYDWDKWSMADKRYHSGECAKKWETFDGSDCPVTGGTILQMAKENGYRPYEARELEWDDIINFENETDMSEETESASYQLIRYLETLFEVNENVGYVTESWEKDGKYLPAKGHCDRTAGQLIEALSKCNGDIGAVLGDYNPKAGAWIRFNPLDGNGVKNENVTDYRFTLVESDNMDLSKQEQIIRTMKLPVAALVESGNKSIHAIVRVDAGSKDEYRKRVEYIYKQCNNAGLIVDIANKNPARLSRMPGVMRNGKMQRLLATNIGCKDFAEFEEYSESINDNLPDEESLASVWNNMPELSPELIYGVLRQGHKMLISGMSKAGKSYGLIELCIAIAEGTSWFGFKCAKGRVLYVNLELDRASCLHRFKAVYEALKVEPKNLDKIDIWNLRGKSCPMDKLSPKLIRRAKQKGYIVVIIDPIYKVITGDENSADQMANFCNQFDKICTELRAAVVYCHHHSKGSQVGKRSMDRASGSGVFARDPDALIDISELVLNDSIIKQLENNAVCEICRKHLERADKLSLASQDDLCSEVQMRDLCSKTLTELQTDSMYKEIAEARKAAQSRTAWRIEGTLREFARFKPINLWFEYPIHKVDTTGILNDVDINMGFNSKGSPYGKNFNKKRSKEDSVESRKQTFETYFESLKSFSEDGAVSLKDMAGQLNKSERSIRGWVENELYDNYRIVKGKIEKIE